MKGFSIDQSHELLDCNCESGGGWGWRLWQSGGWFNQFPVATQASSTQATLCSHQAAKQPALNGNPSCPKLSLGWGKWPLLAWGSAPGQIKTKTGGEIAADSPLGPGQGLGQGLWRTRSISRRWSRLKATQSGDPVWGEIMKLILGLLLLLGAVLAEDEDCPDFDCPVKDGSFAVSIFDQAP